MPINVEKLTYSYHPDSAPALRNVSFDMGAGDYLAVTGASGSGKTTLALLLAGLLRPAGGRVIVNGLDINSRSYRRGELYRKAALMFGSPEKQLFESSVEREVAFALRGRGLDAEAKRAAVQSAMDTVGLDYESFRALPPHALPLYQRRLVVLASLLVSGPQLLLLDEPLAGLDDVARLRFLDVIDRVNREGTAIVLFTRDTAAAAERAKLAAVLRERELVRFGEAKPLFMDYYDILNNSLDVPDVRRAVQLLRERGIGMPENVVSYEQFIDRLKIIMWRKEI